MREFLQEYGRMIGVISTVIIAVAALATLVIMGNQNLREDIHQVDERLSGDLDKVDERLSGEINYVREDIEEEMRRNHGQLERLLGGHGHDDEGRAFFYGPRETEFCPSPEDHQSMDGVSISALEGAEKVHCAFTR